MFDMFKLFGKMGEIKKSVNEVKESLNDINIEVSDPSELVTVRMTAAKHIQRVEIDPTALFPDKKEDLEQAIAKAFTKANAEATQKSKDLIQATVNEKYPEIAGMDIAKYFG